MLPNDVFKVPVFNIEVSDVLLYLDQIQEALENLDDYDTDRSLRSAYFQAYSVLRRVHEEFEVSFPHPALCQCIQRTIPDLVSCLGQASGLEDVAYKLWDYYIKLGELDSLRPLQELTPAYVDYSEALLETLGRYYDLETYRKMLYARLRTDIACCIFTNILQLIFDEDILYRIRSSKPSSDYLDKIIDEKAEQEAQESDQVEGISEGDEDDV